MNVRVAFKKKGRKSSTKKSRSNDLDHTWTPAGTAREAAELTNYAREDPGVLTGNSSSGTGTSHELTNDSELYNILHS